MDFWAFHRLVNPNPPPSHWRIRIQEPPGALVSPKMKDFISRRVKESGILTVVIVGASGQVIDPGRINKMPHQLGSIRPVQAYTALPNASAIQFLTLTPAV